MITGKRVRLAPMERSLIPKYVEWLNDPEVTAGLTIHWAITLAGEEAWFDGLIKRDPVEVPLSIQVLNDGNWLPVGNIGFHAVDQIVRASEIGIFIGDKRFWNSGYGTDAMRLMLRYGFGTLNFHRIWLRVYASNLRAIRCYEKAGFVHEGNMRDSGYKDGKYVDTLFMSVLRHEWQDEDI